MKILKLLKLDEQSLQHKQAKRVAKALLREQDALINELSKDVDSIDESIDKHEEFDLNVDAKKWVQDYQDLLVKQELAKKKLEIAKRTKQKYFVEETE